MKNKKAFTMVELMGVIVILSLILIIAIPTIIDTMKSSDKKQNESFLNNLYIAAEAYVESNIDMFNLEGQDAKDYVLVTELIDNAYLSGNLINPNTSSPIKMESSIIEIQKDEDGIIQYNYIYSGLNNLVTIDNIESLVLLAKSVNSGDSKEGIMFLITRDLNFLDIDSYSNPNDTAYGDINENGTVETIIEELTTSKGFKSIGSNDNEFKGTFYGRNKKIINLYINRPDEDDIGLFGKVSSGFINSVNIKDGNVTGNDRVGLLTGSIYLGTEIQNIQTTGHVSGYGVSLGGIVGLNDGSTISNSNTSANINTLQ
jgi:competence protein ComGC